MPCTEGAMGEGLEEGDLGGVVAPELPLRPGATEDRRLVVAAGRAFGEATTGPAAEAAELTAAVLVGVGRAGAVGAGVTAPVSVDLAVSSGAGGLESAAPGVAPEAAPDLAVVDPVRGGRLTIALEVVKELERKGGCLGTGMSGQPGGSPVGFPKVDNSANGQISLHFGVTAGKTGSRTTGSEHPIAGGGPHRINGNTELALAIAKHPQIGMGQSLHPLGADKRTGDLHDFHQLTAGGADTGAGTGALFASGSQ